MGPDAAARTVGNLALTYSRLQLMEAAMSLGSLVPQPRVLMDGLAFGESPRWHDGRLWFCNWGKQEVIAVDGEGHVGVFGVSNDEGAVG